MKVLSASDLDELCGSNKKIWIRNKAAAIILMSMPNNSNILRLPVSSEPICLNNYYSVETIKQANDLRRMLASGYVELLNPRSPELRKKKGILPLHKSIDISKPVSPLKSLSIVGQRRADSTAMELSANQMRVLASYFVALANGEIETELLPGMFFLFPKADHLEIDFPISVYDEWYTHADKAFEDAYLVGHGCHDLAEVAASMLMREADLKGEVYDS